MTTGAEETTETGYDEILEAKEELKERHTEELGATTDCKLEDCNEGNG